MMRRIWIAASLGFALPAFAVAQHAGGMMGAAPVAARPAAVAAPHVAAAPAPHSAARVATGTHVAAVPGGVYRAPATGTSTHKINIMSGLTNLPLFPTGFDNVPGLGFDYPHLAAVSGGRVQGRFGRFGNGFGFGGFLLSPGVYVEGGGEGQPGPVEEGQAPPPPPEAASDLSDQFLPSSAAASPVPRDTTEYVFVKRDGGLLFAVAYTWENGTLRYVTSDGVRRSVSRDALDLDATQQFNEQRGLIFRVPA